MGREAQPAHDPSGAPLPLSGPSQQLQQPAQLRFLPHVAHRPGRGLVPRGLARVLDRQRTLPPLSLSRWRLGPTFLSRWQLRPTGQAAAWLTFWTGSARSLPSLCLDDDRAPCFFLAGSSGPRDSAHSLPPAVIEQVSVHAEPDPRKPRFLDFLRESNPYKAPSDNPACCFLFSPQKSCPRTCCCPKPDLAELETSRRRRASLSLLHGRCNAFQWVRCEFLRPVVFFPWALVPGIAFCRAPVSFRGRGHGAAVVCHAAAGRSPQERCGRSDRRSTSHKRR